MDQKKPKVDLEFVVQVLVDADQLGDKESCKKYGICEKTVTRYRQKYLKIPEVSVQVQALKNKLAEEWLIEARQNRYELLKLVMTLAKKTVDLHRVVGAFKIVNDAVLASELLTPEDVQRFKSSSLKGKSSEKSAPLSTPAQLGPNTTAH